MSPLMTFKRLQDAELALKQYKDTHPGLQISKVLGDVGYVYALEKMTSTWPTKFLRENETIQ